MGVSAESPEQPERKPSLAGRRLKDLRLAHNWSQEDMAAAAGVSKGWVQQSENGKIAKPGKKNMAKSAKALGWPNRQVMVESTALEPPPLVVDTLDISSGQDYIDGAATTTATTEAPCAVGAVWAPRRLYRAVAWGSWVNPLRPETADLPARPYPEVTLVDDDDIERVGPNGFALLVNGDLLSNWLQSSGRRVGPRWSLWINPDRLDAVVPGAAIGYRHPTLGNVALLLVEEGGERYVSTDIAGEVEQQRWEYSEARLLGPVVLALQPPGMLLRVPVLPSVKP